MRLETVAESFATYRAKVLPTEAPSIQIIECQRAFYAGVYFTLMNLAYNIGDDSTSEEQGIEQLEQLKAECEAFAAAGGMPLPTPAPPAPSTPDVNYTIPDPAEIRPLLQELGDRIGSELPNGWGFNLLLFEFGQGGGLFYISSANREDVIATMREFIRRQTQ
ncbi:MAG TPA: hypothetical protein VKR23_16120 [Gaiellaceae bacterium]|nr:hypothetical protein [Gaiellaceae bacterium]